MRAAIENGAVVVLVLSLGCPAPPEVTPDDGASSEGPPPTSTGMDVTTSPPPDGTTGASGDGGSTTRGSDTGTAGEASSAGSGDSSTGEPMDEPLGPFGRAVAVTELNGFANEDDPTLTGDMLEIYFGSNRNGTEDVFTSTRASVDDPWEMPEPVDVLSSPFIETFPEVSADGLVLLLASDRLAGTDLDVYYSQRANRSQEWSAPMLLSGAATPGVIDWGATPTPDMSRVLLCRDPPMGVGQVDIWEASADFTRWTVGTAVHVDELASATAECSSSVSPSGREIFFETTRADGFTWGIWTATREDPEGAWEEPLAVEELDLGFDQVDPWLSPDRRTLWFASGTAGAYDLYVATRR